MNYTIKGRQFTYTYNYKQDKHLRDSFNALTQKVYGFNFEKWYQDGYWQDKYIPHSLLFDGVVVANASVNIIDFELNGEKRKYIQIGTVMTEPEFRNMGLSRFLIEKIMEEWTNKCDMIYLFANDSVIEFYPKFGFQKADEYQYSKEILNSISSSTNSISSNISTKKIDMDNTADREALYNIITKSKPSSVFQMKDNVGLIMFYCTSFMKDNVYHIPEYNAYVIASYDDDTLYLMDIFSELDFSLNEIITAMTSGGINKVVLGFTPNEPDAFNKNLLKEEDTTLFVFGEDAESFQNNQLMFPILSHA